MVTLRLRIRRVHRCASARALAKTEPPPMGDTTGRLVRDGEAELHVRDARALQRGPAVPRETDTDQPGEDAP